MEKLGSLNKWSKCNIISNGTNIYSVVLKWSIEKDKRHYFCGILAKSTQPDFNHEKTSGKLRLREKFSKVTGLNIFNVKVVKCKASPGNCSRLKETQEIWQINETYYSELDPIVFFSPFVIKCITETNIFK